MRDSRPMRDTAGFSAPELLVVIALMGLFALFGGPALAEAYRAYRVRAAADELVTSLRAVRYNAVANRAPATVTLNDQSASPPNQYSYANSRGQVITVRLQFVTIETGGPATVTFTINGGTGSTGSQTVRVSSQINDARNDRYTITITPTGTVSSAYSTF